jgi:antirestriction protein ArdC
MREDHGETLYVPSRDFISMPSFEAFRSADHFYSVPFHELLHWTGNKSRLDRDLKNRFGSRNYAAEELIAELGAAFLCAEFGFDGNVRNAGYIADWIELLKADISAEKDRYEGFLMIAPVEHRADLNGLRDAARRSPTQGTCAFKAAF